MARPVGKAGKSERTCDDPKLPEHDKRTTNSSGSHLSRVDRDGRILCADTNTHDEACSEQLLPCPGKAGADRGGSKTACGDKDFTTSSKVVIQRVDDECSASKLSVNSLKCNPSRRN